MTTYHANVERGERFWLIHVPEVDRWTQARNLREIEPMARDLIATMEQVDIDSFELHVTIALPAVATKHWEHAKHLREQSARLQSEAAEEAREAARALAHDGLTLREIGELLGVSHQRAGQLVNQ